VATPTEVGKHADPPWYTALRNGNPKSMGHGLTLTFIAEIRDVHCTPFEAAKALVFLGRKQPDIKYRGIHTRCVLGSLVHSGGSDVSVTQAPSFRRKLQRGG
jgi:hypothetical protein